MGDNKPVRRDYTLNTIETQPLSSAKPISYIAGVVN